MSTTRPFAVNTGTTISGTSQIGSLAIGVDVMDYSIHPGGVTWWMGPDEDLGDIIGVPTIALNSVEFWRTSGRTTSGYSINEEFVSIVNSAGSRRGQTGFTNTVDAKGYIDTIGYTTFSGITFEPEATVLFAKMTGETPTQGLKELINTTIRNLKVSGLWDIHDVYYRMDLQDTLSSTLNWKGDDRFNLTAINSPTWTKSVGFKGGTGIALNTNYVPSTHGVQWTLEANFFGVNIKNNIADDGATVMGGLSSMYTYIRPRRLNDATILFNNSLTYTGPSSTTSQHFYHNGRNAGGLYWGFDKQWFSSSRATTGNLDLPMYILACAYGGSFSYPQAWIVNNAYIGGFYNQTQRNSLMDINTYFENNVKTAMGMSAVEKIIYDGNTVGWYDSSDASTIIKDGSNYVSQWSDKSSAGHHLLQPFYGSELISNGTFSTSTGWQLNTGTTIHDGSMYLSNTGATRVYAYIGSSIVSGTTYTVTFTMTGEINNILWGNGGGSWQAALNGTNTYTWTPDYVGPNFYFNMEVNSGGVIDDLSVKQVYSGRSPLWTSSGITFNGTSNWMETAAFTFYQPHTVWLVFKQITWTVYDVIIDGKNHYTHYLAQDRGGSPHMLFWVLNPAQEIIGELPLDTYGIVKTVAYGSLSRMRVNSETELTGNLPPTFYSGNMGGFRLGSDGGTFEYPHMEVKEIILRNSNDNLVDEAVIYDYLSGKYGIYEPESTALFARMSSQPTDARKALYDKLIRKLKNYGYWNRIDVLRINAAHDAQAAILNLKGNYWDGVAVNSPIFTVDRGFRSTYGSSYINGYFYPSQLTGWTQDNATLMIYMNTQTVSASSVFQVVNYSGSVGRSLIQFRPHQSIWTTNINDVDGGSLTSAGARTDFKGFSSVRRNISTQHRNGMNKTYASITRASGTPISEYELEAYGVATQSMVMWAQYFADDELNNIQDIVMEYLIGVGAKAI